MTIVITTLRILKALCGFVLAIYCLIGLQDRKNQISISIIILFACLFINIFAEHYLDDLELKYRRHNSVSSIREALDESFGISYYALDFEYFDTPESSAFIEIGYSEDEEVLYADFRTSGSYYYFYVPESVWNDFKNAKSKGTFFNAEIKDNYEYLRLD